MAKHDFQVEDWRVTDRAQRKSRLKRALYYFLRPILAANARRHLSRRFLEEVRPDAVYFTRGTPLEWRRRWGTARVHIPSATFLIQGTGTGWDVLSWAELRPARIVATDIFAFDESWEQIARYCHDALGVPVEFRAAPLEDHGFLGDGAIDFCGSDAVFEHCTAIDAVLAETHRLLRRGGSLYASYGPLWFAPGGDHFSGRGGPETIYSHLELGPVDYRSYFAAHMVEHEDFQSGGRYVELDLFSKLTTREYLAAFARAGLTRDAIIIELAADALAFRRRYPERFRELVERCGPRCIADDLLVKANFVRLMRG